jgi:hypothetical protein
LENSFVFNNLRMGHAMEQINANKTPKLRSVSGNSNLATLSI